MLSGVSDRVKKGATAKDTEEARDVWRTSAPSVSSSLSDNTLNAHPRFWAPFVLAGEGDGRM
jgi:hypothetical protein